MILRNFKLIFFFELLIAIVAIVAVVSFAVFESETNYRYRISDARGVRYHADSYQESNGCVTFQTCNCGDGATDQANIQICGNYTIYENPYYRE